MKQPKALLYAEAGLILSTICYLAQPSVYLMILLTLVVIYVMERLFQENNEAEIYTENRELQEELRFRATDSHLKSKQLMTIVASIPFPILLLDSYGNIVMHNNLSSLNENEQEYDKYTYLNNSFYHSVREFVKDAFILEQAMDKVITINHVEFQAISVPVLAKSKYSGTLILFQDISKTLEGEKMQKRFIADASHELKTPIAVIKGMAEILNRDDFNDEETAREFIGQIAYETQRLDDLVKDLLQLSRLSMSNMILKRERFRVVECMNHAVDLLKNQAEQKQLHIVTDYQLDETVFIDPKKMEQVFINLLSNAIKYSEKGTITLRTYRENIYLVAEVEDQGCGLQEDELARIFERFYRINDDRSRKSGGSGLGLAIVKSICEAHQIKIDVISTYGSGSTFRLWIRC